MGILDRLFKSDSEGTKEESPKGLPWEMLESIEQFHNVMANSSKKPKVIFKHSTRCGISRMVLKNFEMGYTLQNGVAGFYLLDLLNNREVSNEIASKLNVSHQSPQIIILRDEQVLHTESHHGIDIHKVEELINNNL
ncbi:MAG: bacillithiol system redox-active protein YtxJ [Nonlabens sp.]|nr:bacillithiol system redox-active protein YtxJ [Nonlabens sp.]MDP5099861.1 bacillithiol system redox-active protein YtxJ [Nonlabens sp.]